MGRRTRSAGRPCIIRSPRRVDGSPPRCGRSGQRGRQGLRHGAERLGDRRRLGAYPSRQDMQSAVFDLLGIGAEEAQSKFGFLLDALKLRRAAARRHRLRPRPPRDADGRRRQHPRRHRLPEDADRGRPADRRADDGQRGAAQGAAHPREAAGEGGRSGSRAKRRRAAGVTGCPIDHRAIFVHGLWMSGLEPPAASAGLKREHGIRRGRVLLSARCSGRWRSRARRCAISRGAQRPTQLHFVGHSLGGHRHLARVAAAPSIRLRVARCCSARRCRAAARRRLRRGCRFGKLCSARAVHEEFLDWHRRANGRAPRLGVDRRDSTASGWDASSRKLTSRPRRHRAGRRDATPGAKRHLVLPDVAHGHAVFRAVVAQQVRHFPRQGRSSSGCTLRCSVARAGRAESCRNL